MGENTDKLIKFDICSETMCTGCGLCKVVCPTHCISMSKNEFGEYFPVIDYEKCVGCDLCKKSCPSMNRVDLKYPIKAYAAWNSDNAERECAASGGIATSIYEAFTGVNCYVTGAVLKKDFNVDILVTCDKTKTKEFKNSKYVFSKAYEIYDEVISILKQGKYVIYIGLPCQVAAIKKYAEKKKILKNLVLIDIVCHGTCSNDFLRKHIKHIESKRGRLATKCYFRDPKFKTKNFVFSLYNNDEEIYHSFVERNDVYQVGYHKALIYRKNCYNCLYARNERVGDLTISDYKGLGKYAPCDFNSVNVSSVLVNTEKGEAFINNLIKENKVIANLRPVKEPLEGDKQLNNPSVPHKNTDKFRKNYIEKGCDFEKAAHIALRKDILRYQIKYFSKIDILKDKFRKIISKMLGDKLKTKIKKVLLKIRG